MRRAISAAAALLLAACVVDVEGAPCLTPGDASDCPPGQACGNDFKCSEQAAACAVTRCTPGVSQCLDGDARLERCDAAADPVCGMLVVEDCTAQGLRCATRGATSACECPPNAGAEFAAGAGGSANASAAPYPTGLASPEACRYGRLGDALAAAAAYTATGPSTVQVHARAGTPVVFGAGTSEAFPLQVAAGVTLRGSTTPAGETAVRADAGSTAAILSVQGVVEDVRVENVSMTGTGIATSCGPSGFPALLRVKLSGASTLARGVAVAGACGAELSLVDVSGVDGPALLVDAAAGAPVTVRGSRFGSSEIGVELRGGAASFVPEGTVDTEVGSNALQGFLIGGTTRVDAALDRVLVASNGGTGISLRSVPAASSLSLSGCEIHSNGSTAASTYGGASPRTAGGVLLSQLALASHSILGNRIYANAGDQLAFESSGTWSISPGTCGAQSNAFGCVTSGVAVAKVGTGSVDAAYTAWPVTPPDGFYFGNVANADLYCPDPPGPPAPACP